MIVTGADSIAKMPNLKHVRSLWMPFCSAARNESWHEMVRGMEECEKCVMIEGYVPVKAKPFAKDLYKRKPYEIYYHFDAAGELLYIGISKDAYQRLDSHLRGHSRWFDQIASLRVRKAESLEEARLIEMSEIKRLNPKYNKQHKVKA